MAKLLLDLEPAPPELGPMPPSLDGPAVSTSGMLRDAVAENVARLTGMTGYAVRALPAGAAHANVPMEELWVRVCFSLSIFY